jgi:hypothetical protein
MTTSERNDHMSFVVMITVTNARAKLLPRLRAAAPSVLGTLIDLDVQLTELGKYERRSPKADEELEESCLFMLDAKLAAGCDLLQIGSLLEKKLRGIVDERVPSRELEIRVLAQAG